MAAFLIKVTTPSETHVYEGVFASYLDARLDAMERFWNEERPMRIGVRKVDGGAR